MREREKREREEREKKEKERENMNKTINYESLSLCLLPLTTAGYLAASLSNEALIFSPFLLAIPGKSSESIA